MKAKPYQRENDGERLAFHGMNLVLPPDKMPAGKYPFAQNVRAYLRDRTTGRDTQDAAVETLPFPVHSLRRLNDSTPAGPVAGFILVAGASTNLYAGVVQVDSGLSGNPISLLPFRPNASVQPWMYVGDSIKMDKVRSDGTLFKMGIKEPQTAPTVTFVPASNQVGLLGPVTVYFFNNNPHNAGSVYVWENPDDPFAGGVNQTAAQANGVTQGNSLLFDSTLTVDGHTPVAWSQYTTFVGAVSTAGTAVTWISGNQFGGLTAGNKIVIGGVQYTITGAVTNTTLNITVSAGTQTSVNYSAAALSGTKPLFTPQMESEGYQDFNCAIQATLYIPAAGTYTLSATFKDDMIWGIGNSGVGTATWAGPTGGQTLSTIGQQVTLLGAYPLMPRTAETSGEDGFTGSASVAVTFSAPGNYPLEIDWDYWFHVGRTLVIKVNGGDLVPIPATTITQSQYRYTYRSSATGAVSNPSPESPEASLSVLANNVSATPSTDPQVDKIDIYRLDAGLSNFTYVGTINNAGQKTTTVRAVGVGVNFVPVIAKVTISVGQSFIIDTGPNQETVVLLSISYGPPGIFGASSLQGNFTKAHPPGSLVVIPSVALNDTLLDTDIAANPVLEFDNFEPFPSIDLPRKGLVNVDALGNVTWASGDQFNVRWLPGTIIVVDTVAFTLNTRPTSSTSLTCTNVRSVGGVQTVVVPVQATGVSYEIAEPDLAAQPLPYLWGPTDNISFFFGVGDPLRPGTLYWSKGNNPDSAPDTNQQDVTSPSEPLQNGCLVNGYGWVASTERNWLIVPNFFNALATAQGVEGATWTLQESSLKRGLYIPRCLTVEAGGLVFFRAKDGVYISPGGQGGKSITDDDLYNLFPHEGSTPQPVVIGPFTVFPPDDTQPQAQKMNVANGYMYYDYVDTTNVPRTLVYDIVAQGWVWDVYQHPVTVHALEEGVVNGILCGCQDGSVRPLTSVGAETATSVLMTRCENAGDTRAEKRWGDLYIEAEAG